MTLWVKETLAGEKDRAFLARAQSVQRVTITSDPDFGELAFHFGLPATCGVVLLRIPRTDPETDNAVAVSALTSRNDRVGASRTFLPGILIGATV